MLFICFGDVLLITVCGSALIDIRLLRSLARTFEFWFLHVVLLIGLAASLYLVIVFNDDIAVVYGNDPSLQIYADILWQVRMLIHDGCYWYPSQCLTRRIVFIGASLMLQVAGYIGSVVVVCFDALMVTRNVKLAFDFIWTLNGLRALYGALFTVAEASFMKPILFEIGWETFSIQTIRTEVC